MTVFVFIAGASGSGKSFIAEKVRDSLIQSGVDAGFLSIDDYYKSREQRTVGTKVDTNFDRPQAIDFELFHHHLEELNEGRTINKPGYSFELSDRLPDTTPFEPKEVIIIEGIFALHNFINLTLNHTVTAFVEADSYHSYRLQRTPRDIEKRGRTEKQVKTHELNYVRDGFFKYVLPSRHAAEHRIVNNYQMMLTQLRDASTELEQEKIRSDYEAMLEGEIETLTDVITSKREDVLAL